MEDIKLRMAESKDYDRILDFLRNHYYPEEPLTISCEPVQQDEADEKFNMSQVVHGTCIVAVYTATDDIVGVLLAGPKHPGEAEHLLEESSRITGTKWGKVLKFLASIEKNANVFQRFGVDRALHCHVLTVHSSARGRSIGLKLFQKSMEIGKTLGYPLWTVDCTSIHSARLCERLNMECVNSCAYSDYRDDDGNQLFKPPPPHEFVQTFAIRLK